VIDALAEIGSPKAREHLWQSARSDDDERREYAMHALSELGADFTNPILCFKRRFSEKDSVRRAAWSLLGAIAAAPCRA
jgi:hypothetical protein